VFAQAREARVAREVTAFGKARDRGHASGDPADNPRAAVAGRVATLFVDEAEDLYGSAAETVLAKGGTVVALVRNAIPTETGLAAIYRY